MDSQEIALAYEYWRHKFFHRDCDELIEPYLKLPRLDWLRMARRALFLKPESVAKKMCLTASQLARFERNEKGGDIKLKTMRQIAEAMDCELIYAIRPKNRLRFSQVLWPQVYPDFLNHHWLTKCDQRHRPGALAFLARGAMLTPKYRRAKGWCRQP